MADLAIHLAGQEVLVTPSRALVWEQTVFVADVHFGKDATFRSASLWTPHGSLEDNLSRLSALLCTYHARRLVILGDLFHSAHVTETVPSIRRWRKQWKDCEILVIAGNHDLHVGEIARKCNFPMEDEGFRLGPWNLQHHPSETSKGFTLCGHIHPVVSLKGPGRQNLRLPCFLISPSQCILPAFGAFTGGHSIRPRRNEEILAIADEAVFRVPKKVRRITNERKG